MIMKILEYLFFLFFKEISPVKYIEKGSKAIIFSLFGNIYKLYYEDNAAIEKLEIINKIPKEFRIPTKLLTHNCLRQKKVNIFENKIQVNLFLRKFPKLKWDSIREILEIEGYGKFYDIYPQNIGYYKDKLYLIDPNKYEQTRTIIKN